MIQLIIAAWAISAVLLFLPVRPVARLIGRRFRPASVSPAPERPNPAPAADEEAPAAPPVPPPPTLRKRAMGLFGSLAMVALYLLFVGSSVYLAPRLLVRVLDNEHPMAAITSQSMYPELKRGDLVLLEGVDEAADLRVGDILAFESEHGFAIHRIVEIDGDTITTKGDANRNADEPISFERVIGRALTIRGHLAKISYLGNIPLIFKQTSEEDEAQAESLPTSEGVQVDVPAESLPISEREPDERSRERSR